MVIMTGRHLSEEQSFILDNDGYKYILKKKPDINSLVAIAKRFRDKNKAPQIVSIIFGIITLPLFFLGLIFIACGLSDLTRINRNKESEYECVYYDPGKNTILFHSLDREDWYEFDAKMIRGLSLNGDKGICSVIVEFSNDEQDCVYLKVGYLTKEEKTIAEEKIDKIKKGTFIPMI